MSIIEFIKTSQPNQLAEVLDNLSGFDVSNLMANKTEEEQLLIFRSLNPAVAVETFDYLSHRTQQELLAALPKEQVKTLLNAMAVDDRTALFQELPKEIIEEYLKLLSDEERTVTVKLLGYAEDKVGHIMTTDYLAVKREWTVENVLDHIRAYGRHSETIDVIYVIDEDGILVDDIEIKDLLFVPKNYIVSQVMDNQFIALSVQDSAEQSINIFQDYDRVALPVIDETGLLVGIVTIDDILRLAAEETTEDMQKVGGMQALDEPYMETPFFELMKKRANWLMVLFIGEMFTATAMGFFEEEISKAVVLALFLPLIISSGGNAGSQSSTLIIRAMALGEVTLVDWFKIMKREIFSGLFLGITLGLIGFARVSLWGATSTIYGEHWLLIAFTIFFSLIGVVMWGSLSGSMLPLLLKRLGADPATSSAPLVATLVDVTGISIYFCIALFVLKGTLL